MSNTIIYFGAQPLPQQEVSSELKDQGINLLRLAPSQVRFVACPTTIQPNFDVYKSHLGPFMAVADKQFSVVNKTSNAFAPVPIPEVALPLSQPTIVVSFGYPLPDDIADILRRDHRLADTVIRGKPAMHTTMEISLETISYLKYIRVLMTTAAIDKTVLLITQLCRFS
jgi:hypothetical protein